MSSNKFSTKILGCLKLGLTVIELSVVTLIYIGNDWMMYIE